MYVAKMTGVKLCILHKWYGFVVTFYTNAEFFLKIQNFTSENHRFLLFFVIARGKKKLHYTKNMQRSFLYAF